MRRPRALPRGVWTKRCIVSGYLTLCGFQKKSDSSPQKIDNCSQSDYKHRMPAKFRVIHGDCLEAMKLLPNLTIDMVLADLPYGQTQNKWDIPIAFEPMWRELRRITKPNAAVVLMAAQPFAARLILSNEKEFRYDLIWAKNKPTGFLNANRQPLRIHEHILVFYRSPPIYNPQKTTGHEPGHRALRGKHSTNYGKQRVTEYGGETERFPTSVVPMPIINNDSPDKTHPTQKPVELMEWLVRSYTKPGAIVLDITAGAGTTGVACLQNERHVVLIESELEYAEVCKWRCSECPQ